MGTTALMTSAPTRAISSASVSTQPAGACRSAWCMAKWVQPRPARSLSACAQSRLKPLANSEPPPTTRRTLRAPSDGCNRPGKACGTRAP